LIGGDIYELFVTRILFLVTFFMCARHGTNLTGESPVTGIYHQV